MFVDVFFSDIESHSFSFAGLIIDFDDIKSSPLIDLIIDGYMMQRSHKGKNGLCMWK